MSEINERLTTVQKSWYENNLKPWIDKNTNNNIFETNKFNRKFNSTKECKKYGIKFKDEESSFGYSEPFYTAYLDVQDHDKSTKIVMFVGQETHGYGNFNNILDKEDHGINESHKWMCKKMDINLGKNKSNETDEISYSSVPFFRAMRAIARKYNVCWNNLDKIQYISENVKSMKLFTDDEKELNCEIKNTDYGTLLIEEIKIISPDIIVFAVGPTYGESMKTSLKDHIVGPIISPNKNNTIVNFVIDIDRKIPCLWTYHPGALKYFKVENVLEEIDNILNK